MYKSTCSYNVALTAGAVWLPMPRQWSVFVVLYLMGRTCFISIAHVVFPHSIAQWTIPTVTGDVPPPVAQFSLTQIANNEAVLFGGIGPGYQRYSDLRLATVSRDSVVSVNTALTFSYCVI